MTSTTIYTHYANIIEVERKTVEVQLSLVLKLSAWKANPLLLANLRP